MFFQKMYVFLMRNSHCRREGRVPKVGAPNTRFQMLMRNLMREAKFDRQPKNRRKNKKKNMKMDRLGKIKLCGVMRIPMQEAQFRKRGHMRSSRSQREGRVPNVGVSDTGFQKLIRNLTREAKF